MRETGDSLFTFEEDRMEQEQAVLVTHVDCNKVSREELAAIPTPGETATFKPVSHIELVMSLQAILETRGLFIAKEQFAVRSDGSRLFGTFDLTQDHETTCPSLGFRTANDRTMKISIVAGLRVFVCDNLALSGDSVVLNRKHTAGLDLLPELMSAIGRYQIRYSTLLTEIRQLADTILMDTEAKALIHDAFLSEIMPIRFMPNVSDAYFKPTVPEFEPRTAWSLHNAFTGTMKEMSLNRRMEATQGLGKVFGLLGNAQGNGQV